MTQHSNTGAIVWHDLTVPDAVAIRDFYESVIGWSHGTVSMGDYDDFSMVAPGDGSTVAGICHARGENASQPAQWMMYVAVDDLDASLERCVAGGGEVVTEVRGSEEYGRFCVIRDPAGAVLALMQLPQGGDGEKAG